MTTTPALPGLQRESRLLQAFVHLADTLVDDYDTTELLQQLIDYCCDLLEATAAGIMLSDQRGNLQLAASSSEQTHMLELFQLQANEGPCLDCYRTGQPVHITDMAAATDRWPQFATEATNRGYAAVHAVPLQLRSETIGALNLFNDQPDGLSDQDAAVARALADNATIGILHERAIRRSEVLTEQLQTALNNRVTIEQAKGVLAYAGNLDLDQAFQTLRQHARNHQTRLSDLANQLVTGQLDPNQFLAATSNKEHAPSFQPRLSIAEPQPKQSSSTGAGPAVWL
jgi:transcriptional regulator with GAF, ATPase, and Fis domain